MSNEEIVKLDEIHSVSVFYNGFYYMKNGVNIEPRELPKNKVDEFHKITCDAVNSLVDIVNFHIGKCYPRIS